ncbi:MAG: bifunctional demethylmenaquinone methyltransferase/2-methoxy-6-polyprenyl-1,4-benzoquinol methylase UbiE [Phycisphaerae bacterium]|nr:bifunctional demethylmenaquinone methyltransferase/2-methoxy-6-polyprenyl-1,4-benzoquinol methylase UbiE [Phycisphaerae bacterium]
MTTRNDAWETIWDEERLSDPHGQSDKAVRVQAMFDQIAPTYELVNRVLSAGRDAYWRRKAVAMTRVRPTDRVLDLACGTGDFARAFARASPAAVVGCDFSRRMLELAAGRNKLPTEWKKSNGLRPARPPDHQPSPMWCRADALALPFTSESYSVVSCAFGVRNFQDLSHGLNEMYRVLRPGGRAVILEFSMPRTPLLGTVYLFYFRQILPRLAALISRDRCGAYRYLPMSVRSFVDRAGMIEKLRSAGFRRVEHRVLTIGIVTVFVAWKE